VGNRIRAATSRYNEAQVLVDSTGAGEPIFEALRHAGCYVRPYQFTARSKSALIDALALLFEQRQIVIPKKEIWPEGIEELEAFEYSITDAGSVRTSAPYGVHDDCVIALALAAWELGPARATRQVKLARLLGL
jgi:hypothetical protein